ncbi:MAG: energy transducer TonB [Bacteroidota bacterium]
MKKTLVPIFVLALLTAQAQKPQEKTKAPAKGFGVSVVQSQPEYPGGPVAMQQFLLENLQYPEAAKTTHAKGTVYVGFKVGRDGKISNSRVLKSPDSVLDGEALRLVSIMPDWTPGTVSGSPVDVQYVLPIEFVVPQERKQEGD